MSHPVGSLGKVRSFAQAREPDVAVVRSGLTYGDCRAILTLVETLERELTTARRRAADTEGYLHLLGVLQK
jgi:hypothetical protein